MKKGKRILAVTAMIVYGLGSGMIYGAKEDVEAVFKLLRGGHYKAVLHSSLTKDEIVNARDAWGNSLIAEAVINVKRGSEKELAKFIKQYIDNNLPFQKDREKLLNAQNKKGQTALMFAAQEGLMKVAQQLHDLGASSLLKDKKDNTALFYYMQSSYAGQGGEVQFMDWWNEDQDKKRK